MEILSHLYSCGSDGNTSSISLLFSSSAIAGSVGALLVPFG
jgi:hypothetical protein